MSEPAGIHHASLQYQVHTDKHGHTDLRKHQPEYEAMARRVQEAVMQSVDTHFRRYYADIVGAENSRRRGLKIAAGAGDTAKSPVNRRRPCCKGNNQQGLGSQPTLLMFTEIRAPVC